MLVRSRTVSHLLVFSDPPTRQPTYRQVNLPPSQIAILPHPLTPKNTCLMFEQSTLNSSCLSHLAICAYAHVPLVAAGCKCSGEPDGDILCACFQNRQPLQFRASQSVQAPAGLSRATILSHVWLPCKGIKRARSWKVDEAICLIMFC